MGIEIFLRLSELSLEEQPVEAEYGDPSASISDAAHDTHFTIWGSPDQWDTLSQWARECAEARRKALARTGVPQP